MPVYVCVCFHYFYDVIITSITMQVPRPPARPSLNRSMPPFGGASAVSTYVCNGCLRIPEFVCALSCLSLALFQKNADICTTNWWV